MGKVDDMKALKAQLREELAGQIRAMEQGARKPAAKAGKGIAGARQALVIVDEAALMPGLCGHRSIGNKSCTRPVGHAEKNHRYAKS